ncbi:hypothetical protein DNTS_015177 [Danionella cerebrum]|uniref:Mitochondrial antiviral-signaling protein n=1 Tax=Danionella cerebrum TaxID=2873325 RepID=A0A553MZH9_9TELE|nr:hypothetical protein DNTS_015177 [Danionella translucida]
MSLFREQFYNQAIRPRLARFSSDVSVSHILPHLPCLTIVDREEIMAKKEASGNYIAMQLLLDNIRRRDNWPEEFLRALRECESFELADEINVIYDRIRGIPNVAKTAPAPPFPPVTSVAASTTTVTIHTIPPTPPAQAIPPPQYHPIHSIAGSNSETQDTSSAPIPETQPPKQTPSPSPPPENVYQHEMNSVPSQASEPAGASEVPLQISTDSDASKTEASVLDALNGMGSSEQTTTSLPPSENDDPTTNAEKSISISSQIQPTMPCTSQILEGTPGPVVDKATVTSEKAPIQETHSNILRGPVETSEPMESEVLQTENDTSAETGRQGDSSETVHAAAPIAANAQMSITQDFSKPGILLDLNSDSSVEPCSLSSSGLEISQEHSQSRAGAVPIVEAESHGLGSGVVEIREEPAQSRGEAVEAESPIMVSSEEEIREEPAQSRVEAVEAGSPVMVSSEEEIREEPSQSRVEAVEAESPVMVSSEEEIREELVQNGAESVPPVDAESPAMVSSEEDIREEPAQNRVEAVEAESTAMVSSEEDIREELLQNGAEAVPPVQSECLLMVSSDEEVRQKPAQNGAKTAPCLLDSASQALENTSDSAAVEALNQPVEDYYSLSENQTLVNEVHFAEEAPVENLNGLPPSVQQDDRYISEEQSTLNHIDVPEASAHGSEADHEKSAMISGKEQESNPAAPGNAPQAEQREEGRPELFLINNLHLIAAAGILSAVFVAWKINH